MSTTALATSAASTNRQLVLRPPSTGTDRKNHTRDRGAPRLRRGATSVGGYGGPFQGPPFKQTGTRGAATRRRRGRSEEHTSELQSRFDLVCRLLLEKKTTHS